MRSVTWVLLAACGPMYRQPGGPPSPSPPPSASPSGGGQDPWEGPPGGAADPAAPSAAAPPASAPTAAPTTSGPAAGPPTGSIARRFLQAHDQVRAQHCAPALTWSPTLAAYAQKWADSLRDHGCAFGHSGGPYGENLAAGTVGVLDPEATVAMWADEGKHYAFPDGGFSMRTGHFTQLVWRETTQVGCGHAQCKGNDIWVCEYDPAGNVEGEYRQNVRPKGCK